MGALRGRERERARIGAQSYEEPNHNDDATTTVSDPKEILLKPNDVGPAGLIERRRTTEPTGQPPSTAQGKIGHAQLHVDRAEEEITAFVKKWGLMRRRTRHCAN